MEDLLRTLALRANCRRRQVGALIVKGSNVVGRGWNGLIDGSCLAGDCPRGLATTEECPPYSPYTNCAALHAEVSALKEAGPRAAGATCYVTADPCNACRAALREAGVINVVVQTGSTPIPAAASR